MFLVLEDSTSGESAKALNHKTAATVMKLFQVCHFDQVAVELIRILAHHHRKRRLLFPEVNFEESYRVTLPADSNQFLNIKSETRVFAAKR